MNTQLKNSRFGRLPSTAAFTMVEIALCLAVIGFALVAIIGVLPIGMNVQKDNREETVINFDANFLADAIRSGGQGLDDLTNYVFRIEGTNTGVFLSTGATTNFSYSFGHTNYFWNNQEQKFAVLTNGMNIVGLLSHPKYVLDTDLNIFWSNSVVVYMRSISGAASDLGGSSSSADFAFGYAAAVESVPAGNYPFKLPAAYVAANPGDFNFTGSGIVNDTNGFLINDWQQAKAMQAHTTELRLRFRWPSIPGPVVNGTNIPNRIGNGKQSYRTIFSGTLQTKFGLPVQGPAFGYPLYFNNTVNYTNRSTGG